MSDASPTPSTRAGRRGCRLAVMSLLTEQDAHYTEQRRCGHQDAGVEGAVVRIDCERGARIAPPC
jgi:hypothetical protein